MGRIPRFTETIFPADSMPSFSLVANLGLVLFLFLVGLEVDLRYLASNWRIAASVGFAGMALPFGLGCGISYGLYHSFREDANIKPISFGTYMLFIAIAMAITVSPVPTTCIGALVDSWTGLSRALSYFDGAEAFGYACWDYCAISWCRQ